MEDPLEMCGMVQEGCSWCYAAVLVLRLGDCFLGNTERRDQQAAYLVFSPYIFSKKDKKGLKFIFENFIHKGKEIYKHFSFNCLKHISLKMLARVYYLREKAKTIKNKVFLTVDFPLCHEIRYNRLSLKVPS